MSLWTILQRIGASVAAIAAFSGAWWLSDLFLTGAPVVGAIELYLFPASALAWGALTTVGLAFGARRDSPVTHGVILFAGLALAIGIPRLSTTAEDYLFHRDPIGVADDVARGPCRTREVVVLPNRRGSVADLRETYCYGNWDGDLMYFVFIHPENETNTRQNLAFRYSADTLPDIGPPGVRWLDARTLRVVAYRDVMDVSEQRPSIGNISIRYVLRYEPSQ